MRNEQHIVESKQTIYDVAAQKYGNIDGVWLLFNDNPDLDGLVTVLVPGQVLKIKSDPIDANVVEYFKKNNVASASEVDDIDSYDLDTYEDFNNDFNLDFE